jgi:hypothetical protein
MPTAAEAATAKSQLAADIAAGVNALSLNQTVTFVPYTRVVLAADGYVFWVVNSVLPTLTVQGSLHYSTDRHQNEDETPGVNQVVFTSLQLVTDLNTVSPTTLYVASFGPDAIQVAFSSRSPFYQLADTYHYVGTAILPAMQTQFLSTLSGFDTVTPVVSNSLPIWLSFNSYTPPYPGFSNTTLELFPSFAVPDNLLPPYASVHIEPSSTTAIQPTPFYDSTLSDWQLAHDVVRITFYGLRNPDVMNFRDCVLQYSRDTSNIGMMGMPIVRDEKRTQAEASILAEKKTIEFNVSYYQTTARGVARQLILSTQQTYLPQALSPQAA